MDQEHAAAGIDPPTGSPAPEAPKAYKARPYWMENTKHERRWLPRRAPRTERPKRNPWVTYALGLLLVAAVVGIGTVALQRWQDRVLVAVPDAVAGYERTTDPDLVAYAQRIRDSEIRDPKYSASRFEVAPYQKGDDAAVVLYVPAGRYMGDDDLASFAATIQQSLFGPAFVVGEVHCMVSQDDPENRWSYCYRTGADYTVIAVTAPDDERATRGVRVVDDGYAAQG